MDRKYGRLFTADDVQKVLEHFDAQFESSFTEVADQAIKGGVMVRFPADEPQMVLRGQDQKATAAITAYEHACRLDPRAPEEHIGTVHRVFHDFDGFRAKHPERMKVPD